MKITNSQCVDDVNNFLMHYCKLNLSHLMNIFVYIINVSYCSLTKHDLLDKIVNIQDVIYRKT